MPTGNRDPLARGLAATIIVVFLLGIIARSVGFIHTDEQQGAALVICAASYMFGGWVGRNGH